MALADSKLSPIPMLLAQSELLLTDEQKAELGGVDLDLRASLVAIMAERTLIEIEAERESTTPTSGSGLTAASLSAIDGKTTELRRAWLEARDRAREVLSAEQISRLREFPNQPPTFVSEVPVPRDTDLQIAEAIDRRLRDTKVVDIETAQAIAERLFGWTKFFAIFTTVPLTALGMILGVLGVKSYTDLRGKIEDANAQITERIKNEEGRVKQFDDKFIDLDKKYAELSDRYANTTALASRLDNLDNRVQGLESIEACKDKPLPSNIQNSVNQEISEYRNYLVTLGYTPLQRTVTVCSGDSTEAYYDGKSLVIDPSLATDSFTVAHEYTHHMVQTINPAYWSCGSLQCLGILYGFAEYLPASYLGQSQVGQKYVQLNSQVFPETIVKRGNLIWRAVAARMIMTLGPDTP